MYLIDPNKTLAATYARIMSLYLDGSRAAPWFTVTHKESALPMILHK